jgi:hypothetical protein
MILLKSHEDTEMIMPTTLLAPGQKVATFPFKEVEAALLDELIETVKIEASILGISLPLHPAQIAKTSVRIDSLVVVSILCVVEPLLGFELPEAVVKTGGYSSVEDALSQLLPKIEAQWNKKKANKP